MKSFSALTAIVLVAIGSTVWADDPAPVDSIPQIEAEQYGAADGAYLPPVAGGVYADYPAYQPGFTSYRGMGFMGSCCEQTSCCAQNAWDGYCETKGYAPKSLFHGWKDKLHCCLPKPVCCPPVCCPPVKSCDTGCGQKGCPEPTCCDAKPWHGLHFGWKRPVCSAKVDCCDTGCGQKGYAEPTCCDTGCGQKGCPEPTCCDAKPWHGLFGKLGCGLRQADCCDPCGDPCCDEVGGKYGVSPTWHGKLHGLRGHWGGLWQGAPVDMAGECCEPVQSKGMWIPADVQSPHVAPAPEPTTEPLEELPPPTVSTDYVPEFPDVSTQDRSATRHELRRLPNAFMSL